MSLLLAAGHTEAQLYPLGMVSDEADIVTERENNNAVTAATLIQQGVGGILNDKLRKAFTKSLKVLNVQSVPQEGLFEDK